MTLAIAIADSAWVRCESIGRTRVIRLVHAVSARSNATGESWIESANAMKNALQLQTVSQDLNMSGDERTNTDAPSREARGVCMRRGYLRLRQVLKAPRQMILAQPSTFRNRPTASACKGP